VNLSSEPTDRRPLRVEHDADQNLILIKDSVGELLALTPTEAAGLTEDLSAVLDVVGWDR
jgi:hypothetical protein